MINFTKRLDKAIRISAWCHEQAHGHRKGGDIPYIIHPYGVMLIASNVTDNEDTLIACLLHDVLEDVPKSIYDENKMRADFGDNVTKIVKDVTKDSTLNNWYGTSKAYLHHLEFEACDEAIVVSASDKIHNLESTLFDYEEIGDKLWDRFTTKNLSDQIWWYESVYRAVSKRDAPNYLLFKLAGDIKNLKALSEQ